MDGADPDWEYAPLRIPPDVGRLSAAAQLSLHAEFGGWELDRVIPNLDIEGSAHLARVEAAEAAEAQAAAAQAAAAEGAAAPPAEPEPVTPAETGPARSDR